MLKEGTMDDDPGSLKALEELNKPLLREGYEAFYGDVTCCISVTMAPKQYL